MTEGLLHSAALGGPGLGDPKSVGKPGTGPRGEERQGGGEAEGEPGASALLAAQWSTLLGAWNSRNLVNLS